MSSDDGIVDLTPVVDRLMAKYDDATAPTSHARAHFAADLESRAIAMLDDEQLWATFYRWRTVLRGETAARSLRERLSVAEYVDAIYREIPA